MIGTAYFQKQTIYLNSSSVLKYLLGANEYLTELITARGTEFNITTTDFEVYEALGSLKPYDDFKINKLVKFFEIVDVKSRKDSTGNEKSILKHERVDQLRKSALQNK